MDPAHVDLVQDFARKLEGLTMEHCALCKERWFNILDSRGRCKQCASRPGKFTSDNQMDPGE
jgi:formate dehydrogenase maturation protein FdhE